ncbi:MAG: hypothetical protein N2319_01855 [Candidatus Kapabacteria bacterium]|nr:hypothetical protein [Candidatus Kapabacteria bacterium]
MDWIIKTVYTNTLWLYKVIYSNPIFFIDFWTFNHIWSGAFIFILLSAYKVKRKWFVLILILLAYEIIEILFRIFALNLFKPEIIKDQVNDIIFGGFGAVLCYYLIKFRKGKSINKFHLRYPLTTFFTAGTISYLYIGFTNFIFFTTLHNPLLFKFIYFLFLWFAFYYLLQTYETFKLKNIDELKTISLLTIISLPIFIILQIIAILILTNNQENLFSFFLANYLHSTKISNLVFFLILPVIVIMIYKVFKRLIERVISG